MKVTNIKNLGNPYHVLDNEGNQTDVIVVEKHELLQELELPEFDMNEQSYIEYHANCRQRVRGNDFKYNEIQMVEFSDLSRAVPRQVQFYWPNRQN